MEEKDELTEEQEEYNRIQAEGPIEFSEEDMDGEWEYDAMEDEGWEDELYIDTELTPEQEDYVIESGLERARGLDDED